MQKWKMRFGQECDVRYFLGVARTGGISWLD